VDDSDLAIATTPLQCNTPLKSPVTQGSGSPLPSRASLVSVGRVEKILSIDTRAISQTESAATYLPEDANPPAATSKEKEKELPEFDASSRQVRLVPSSREVGLAV
jgi:hypothetical protein